MGSHRSPECMCIVSIVWLRSRDDYSDPWEGPKPSFGPSDRVEDVCKDERLEMIGPCVQKVVIAASSSWMFIARDCCWSVGTSYRGWLTPHPVLNTVIAQRVRHSGSGSGSW